MSILVETLAKFLCVRVEMCKCVAKMAVICFVDV